MKYNKLVRDKIIDIIKAKGEKAVFHIASDEEYGIKLKEKLSEEVSEFNAAENEEEIADILEVIDAIMEYKSFNKEKILEIKEKKAAEKGAFGEKVILDES